MDHTYRMLVAAEQMATHMMLPGYTFTRGAEVTDPYLAALERRKTILRARQLEDMVKRLEKLRDDAAASEQVKDFARRGLEGYRLIEARREEEGRRILAELLEEHGYSVE